MRSQVGQANGPRLPLMLYFNFLYDFAHAIVLHGLVWIESW